jgi:excisionase family DNA binding protein
MRIKFQNLREMFFWLSRNYKFKARSWPKNYIDFNDMEFQSVEMFIEFLEGNSIIQITHKPIEILEDTKAITNHFKEYQYEVDFIILDKQNLDSLFSDTFIDPKITDRLLTINEICKILSLTKPSVYRLFNTGKLEYFEILSQRKVKLSDLNRFIKSSKKKV